MSTNIVSNHNNMSSGTQKSLTDLLLSSNTPHDTKSGSKRSFNGDDGGDAIVIISAVRSPIGKATRGCFKDIFPEEILAKVLKESLKKCNIR